MLGVFFYYTIDYIRYLINEKCKCSEDMRRELIMGGSIIELILIVTVFIGSMLIPVTGTCVASVIDNAAKTSADIKRTVSNPYTSVLETPKKLSKSASQFKNVSKSLMNKVNTKVLKQKS
jgi:predicted PurR-regulated permease PerM